MIFDYVKYASWSKRNIAAAVFALIVMVALYNWFAVPHLQYLQAAQEYEGAADRVEKANKIINAQLQAGRRKFDEISERFRQKRQEFFEIDDARTFLGGVQAEAEKNLCFVDTLKFLPAKQVTTGDSNIIDIRQYQVNLSVIGQYPDIVKLIESLQNRKEKVWIDTINLCLKDTASGMLVCDLSLSIYTLKVKEIVSDVSMEK